MELIKYSHIKRFISIIVTFLPIGLSNTGVAQLEFTKEERLLFVGIDSIESKKIVASVYVTPKDSFNLNLEIDILENWKQKDKIVVSVTLDENSLKNSVPDLTIRNEKFPAYRFTDENGLVVLIAKEIFIETNTTTNENVKPYNMTIIQIFLPKENEFYVQTLPLMFYK